MLSKQPRGCFSGGVSSCQTNQSRASWRTRNYRGQSLRSMTVLVFAKVSTVGINLETGITDSMARNQLIFSRTRRASAIPVQSDATSHLS
jgi:hypothetical protein